MANVKNENETKVTITKKVEQLGNTKLNELLSEEQIKKFISTTNKVKDLDYDEALSLLVDYWNSGKLSPKKEVVTTWTLE